MTKAMTRNTRRLAERARDAGIEVPEWIEIRRTRAGYIQRSMGAWSWWAADANGREVMGSPYTVTELLKGEAIEVLVTHGSYELYPIYKQEDVDVERTD